MRRTADGRFRPQSNTYRIVGDVAYVDISTRKYQNAEAKIDAADLRIVIDGGGRWYCRRGPTTFYATREVAGTAMQMHRHILGLGGGHSQIPDHRDRDGLNNTRENLRLADHSLNRANGRASRNGKFKGVFLRKKDGRYRAIIQIAGVRRHLGCFDTPEAAARAYDAAAEAGFGEFALTNKEMS